MYCLNCTTFDNLILRKVVEIFAIRCHILRLKCTESDFGCGSDPDPTEELTALPMTLAGFKWAYFQGKGRRERDGKRWEKKGRREGRFHHLFNSTLTNACSHHVPRELT